MIMERLMRRKDLLSALVVSAATLVCACAESSIAPSPPNSFQTLKVAVSLAQAQQVAHGIAMALGETPQRKGLLDAMRDSRWNEHKLTLQEFSRTYRGGVLINAAAAAAGMQVDAFRSLI